MSQRTLLTPMRDSGRRIVVVVLGDVMNFGPGRPETEVTEKGKRRRFTAECEQRILRESVACKEPRRAAAA